MLGTLHLWLARRPWDENWWVAIWSGLASAFLVARGVQLTTHEPAAALLAGKVSLAIGPYLVWALVGFGRNLTGGKLGGSAVAWLGGISVAWTLAIVATPWFVDPVVTTRSDFFGQEHLSVHSLWPTQLLTLYIAGAIVWGARRIRRSSTLARGERLGLLAGLGSYALLGIGAMLTSAGVIDVPAMAEYGPLIVAVCLSHLLVQRRRRVESQLEALLREESGRRAASEERYRDLIEHAPIGVLACDASGDVTTLNPRMAEMLRESGEPDDGLAASGVDRTVRSVLETREVTRTEHRMQGTPTGEEQVWQITAAPFEDAREGRGVLVLADDVTERRRLERQLAQARKLDSIGRLAAGIAHEINNPMAFVRTNLNAMEAQRAEVSQGLDPTSKGFAGLAELEALIDESLQGVERTISVVAHMREFPSASDAPSGRADLAAVLDACVRFAAAFHRHDAQVTTELPEAIEVAVTPDALYQVFLNLLVNALQAVDDDGEVRIEATTRGDQVVVSVEDDGPGIPESDREQLFDPFYTTREVGAGMGLGLFMSYQITRGFGGDIRLRDAARGGACFEVSLPALRVDVDPG